MPDAVSLGSIDKKLAILCERLANSQRIQKEINDKIEKHIEQADKRIRSLENCREKVEVKQSDHKDEIDRLRSKSNLVDLLLALGTIIAGIIGINNQ